MAETTTEIPAWLLEAYDNVLAVLVHATQLALGERRDLGVDAADFRSAVATSPTVAIAQGRVEGVGIAAHYLLGDAADHELSAQWAARYHALPLTNDFNYKHRKQSGTEHSHPGFDHDHTAGDEPHEHQCIRDRFA